MCFGLADVASLLERWAHRKLYLTTLTSRRAGIYLSIFTTPLFPSTLSVLVPRISSGILLFVVGRSPILAHTTLTPHTILSNLTTASVHWLDHVRSRIAGPDYQRLRRVRHWMFHTPTNLGSANMPAAKCHPTGAHSQLQTRRFNGIDQTSRQWNCLHKVGGCQCVLPRPSLICFVGSRSLGQ